jgi:hypothetical protein
MVTVLYEQSETNCPTARADGENLWLGTPELERATGWSMKPQGLCRGDICVPVPAGQRADFVTDDAVNVAAFWRRMGNPVVRDDAFRVWVLGTSATHRSTSLQSLEAPDFGLADLAGVPQSLSQQRGKKVLLATWASW